MGSFVLSVQAQHAVLDMQGQNTMLSTRMPLASFDITKHRGGMQIETRHPQVSIDASQALSEENRATNAELLDRFVQQGRETIQNTCISYNRMGQVYRAQITNKNAIARAALDKAIPGLAQPSIRFVPSVPLHVDVSDNIYDYTYTPDTLDVDWDIHQQADIAVDRPAELSIWLAQEPELHLSITA